MNKFLHKIVLSSLLLLFILPSLIGTASAQSGLLFGQNHSYSVIFRGNGEAIVYAKIVITNPDEKPLTEFSFEIPKVSPSEMVMYQMKLPQECVRYDHRDPVRPCLEYRDPDYTQRYYYYWHNNRQAEYQRIQYTKFGNLYRFTLPTQVEPHKSTAIIIAYAAHGYVKESFGLFKFSFETIRVPSRIERIRVAIDVDSDLFLKGKRAQVDYGAFYVGPMDPQVISSRDLDRVVGRIGAYGPLVKEARNLSPNEAFIVRGEYATNWFRLHLSSILLIILIIIAIFAGVYFLGRFLKRRSEQGGQFRSEINQQISSQASQSLTSIFNLTNVLVSFFSAISVIGLTYLLIFWLKSDFFHPLSNHPIFIIISFITIILLYALVIFGPAIMVAIRRGWKSFILILIAEFLWLVIFLFIYLAFLI